MNMKLLTKTVLAAGLVAAHMAWGKDVCDMNNYIDTPPEYKFHYGQRVKIIQCENKMVVNGIMLTNVYLGSEGVIIHGFHACYVTWGQESCEWKPHVGPDCLYFDSEDFYKENHKVSACFIEFLENFNLSNKPCEEVDHKSECQENRYTVKLTALEESVEVTVEESWLKPLDEETKK